MEKKIFLPNVEQSAKILENAWQNLKAEAEKSGVVLNGNAESFAKDMFAAGWAYGWNDCFSVIGGQIEADNMVNEMMKG